MTNQDMMKRLISVLRSTDEIAEKIQFTTTTLDKRFIEHAIKSINININQLNAVKVELQGRLKHV